MIFPLYSYYIHISITSRYSNDIPIIYSHCIRIISIKLRYPNDIPMIFLMMVTICVGQIHLKPPWFYAHLCIPMIIFPVI